MDDKDVIYALITRIIEDEVSNAVEKLLPPPTKCVLNKVAYEAYETVAQRAVRVSGATSTMFAKWSPVGTVTLVCDDAATDAIRFE